MRNIKLFLLAVMLAGNLIGNALWAEISQPPPHTTADQSNQRYDAIIAAAFANHESHLQVYGQGIVTQLLADDDKGSRHQKFVIKLSSGQTLLIVHNIDLAPRIDSLRTGDIIKFYGEYEWNKKGGVIHWTHRDPNGSHVEGWLQYKGQRYQ